MATIDTYEFWAPEDGVIFTTTVGARAMTVSRIFGRFSLSQNCMIIRNRDSSRLRTDFAMWQLAVLLDQKRKEVSNHMQTSFRMSDLNGYWLAFPPMDEQEFIAREVERQTSDIDRLVTKARSLTELLLERRQALISAAVTGKIDVRG
jgi:type I restriction enzyme S subunit